MAELEKDELSMCFDFQWKKGSTSLRIHFIQGHSQLISLNICLSRRSLRTSGTYNVQQLGIPPFGDSSNQRCLTDLIRQSDNVAKQQATKWLFWGEGSSGFSSSSTAEQVTQGIDATGLTAIITGGSSGIGAETARVLALRGVRVVLGVRNPVAGQNTKDDIVKKMPTAKVDVLELDLSSMASVRTFVRRFKSIGLPLNLLINNAGVSITPYMLSADGIELQFATNHLGHFLLTHLLLDTMKETSSRSGIEGRIVNVSSVAHFLLFPQELCFEKINNKSRLGRSYRVSKLANILHANELSRRLKEEGTNITVNSLHPGIVWTNIFRHMTFSKVIVEKFLKYFMKDVQQGAATTCYLALHADNKRVTGEYFTNCNLANAWPHARNIDFGKKLWDFSEYLINSERH